MKLSRDRRRKEPFDSWRSKTLSKCLQDEEDEECRPKPGDAMSTPIVSGWQQLQRSYIRTSIILCQFFRPFFLFPALLLRLRPRVPVVLLPLGVGARQDARGETLCRGGSVGGRGGLGGSGGEDHARPLQGHRQGGAAEEERV